MKSAVNEKCAISPSQKSTKSRKKSLTGKSNQSKQKNINGKNNNSKKSPKIELKDPSNQADYNVVRELHNQINNLKTENQILKEKIRANTKAVYDLTSDIKDIQNSKSSKSINQTNDENQNQNQIESDEFDNLKQNYDDLEIENKILNAHLQRVFISASNFFNENIQNVETLVYLFEKATNEEIQNKIRKSPSKGNNNNNSKYYKKAKELKLKLIEAQKTNARFIEANQQMVKNYEDKIKQLKDQNNEIINKQSKNIEELTNSLEAIRISRSPIRKSPMKENPLDVTEIHVSKINLNEEEDENEYSMNNIIIEEDDESEVYFDEKPKTKNHRNKVKQSKKANSKKNDNLEKYYFEDESNININYYERDSSFLNNRQDSQNNDSSDESYENSDDQSPKSIQKSTKSHTNDDESQIILVIDMLEYFDFAVNLNEDDLFENNQDFDELSRLEADYEALTMIHEETVKEVESLRDALYEKTSKSVEAEIKSMKEQNQKYSIENTQLKQEIEKIQIDYKKANDERNTANKKVENLENIINDLQDQLNDANDELETAEKELKKIKDEEKKKSNHESNSILPAVVFECKKFSPELRESVKEVASNRSLSNVVKIQMILNMVCASFENKIEENKIQQQIDIENCQNYQKVADELLVKYEKEKVPELNRLLKETAQKLIDANKEILALKQKSSKESAKSHAKYEKERKETRKLKKCVEILKKESTEKDAKIVQNEKLNKENEEQISNLSSSVQQLKCDLKTLQIRHQALTEEKDEIYEQLMNEKNIKKAVEAKWGKEKSSMKKQISQLRENRPNSISNTSNRNNEGNDVNHSMISMSEHSQIVETLKDTINRTKKDEMHKDMEYQSKISSLQNQIHILEEESTREKSKNQTQLNEMQKTIENYKNTFIDMQKQCEVHRNDLKKVTHELTQENLKRRKFEQSAFDLETYKQKYDIELQFLHEKIDRLSKQNEELLESNRQIQNANDQKVSELIRKNQTEQVKFLKLISDVFYETQTSPDQESITYMIENAHNELVKLRESDRKIREIIEIDNDLSTLEGIELFLMQQKS
ncbi:hypothetical protein TRFO_14206 [Tritrichomonas foetus]|uniref:Uncharacterized protein n=1 Tax=Tritrichomonas foetus TaxID=1144522 RepID=A0A1J4L0C5_9EUKA|nr:hypothetical protein TRFO_14206 [Tritrichomonas foetus]|eukprot:OHT15301.1 hypothetical protein TRFO_14206 [Tritrichomonas foetus]